jgi:hypothetical protein
MIDVTMMTLLVSLAVLHTMMDVTMMMLLVSLAVRGDDLRKKFRRPTNLDRMRQSTGTGARRVGAPSRGGVNVRFRAHQYSTRHIDIVFRYGENSLRVPRRCPHDDKCCEKVRNAFHVTCKMRSRKTGSTGSS